MLINATPFRFLFLLVYASLFSILTTVRDVLFYWLTIELLMLSFIGISYSVFKNSFSQLMLYFLYQTLASLSILVSFISQRDSLFLLRFFLKLGIFPFYSWYISTLFPFQSSVLFLSLSFHKLPILYFLWVLLKPRMLLPLCISMLLSILVRRRLMFYINDLRYLLILSSLGNNAFLCLSVLANNLALFLGFNLVYFLTVFLVFWLLNSLNSIITRFSLHSPIKVFLVTFLLLNLAAFPPFPSFFLKFLILLNFSSIYPRVRFLFITLMLLSNALIIVSYIQLSIKQLINFYTTSFRFNIF